MNSPGASAIIVAFDGIVANTLEYRAQALADAIRVECGEATTWPDAHELLPLIAGRSFGEALERAMTSSPRLQSSPHASDLTLHEIIAMRAQRNWAAMAQQGVPLRAGVAEQLQREQSRGCRIVVRSDSLRREVEPLLRLAGLEDSVHLLRCADDVPRLGGSGTLRASYAAIDARLNRLGIPSARRTAVEMDGGSAARSLGFVEHGRADL